ncbi:Ig-like domain-containing protein [Botryobacter ruber]|uniref:Ig-like domain-containing protein n=1 Tax=Botryobacter ruber TaxID=2171629 RepID=UPI000E0A12B7|nr:Ig-like domain-containing protein [Botryobacter ruber]
MKHSYFASKRFFIFTFLFALVTLSVKAQQTHRVTNSEENALKTFIENTANWVPGDTILLVSEGEYLVKGTIEIKQNIAIKADPTLAIRPLVTFYGTVSGFRPRANNLSMTFIGFRAKGLTLDEDGKQQRSMLLSFGRGFENGTFANSIIKFENVEASGFSNGIELFYDQGLHYQLIKINNVVWSDFSGWVLDPRINATDKIEITNSTFYNIGGFLKNPYYSKPERPAQYPQQIIINRNTIYKVANGINGADALIQVNDPTDGQVNLMFTNNIVSTLIDPATARPFRINQSAGLFTFENNVFHNFESTKDNGVHNLAQVDAALQNVLVSNTIATDPGFAGPDFGDFTIPESSSLLTAGTNGGPIGDPRWSGWGDVDPDNPAEILVNRIIVSGQGGKSSITVKGGYLQMVATVLPGNAANRSVTWSISDDQLATIDQNGDLVAKASGVVTVTASANDGSGVTGSLDVTIMNQANITSITVVPAAGRTSLNPGETLQLSTQLTPQNPDNPNVNWSVNNSNRASISADGLLTAVAPGEVTVTAAAEENSFMYGTLTLTVLGTPTDDEDVPAAGEPIAFPGAEGYGKYATGGRGGRVVEVTNLNDSGTGSLRAALNSLGTDPITIIFKVSGNIELAGELKSGRSNMTIAGQSAPGDGIAIKNEGIKLSGSNLIIRYLRFRPGNSLGTQTTGLNIENARNIIVDHCSMSWAVEENMGMYDNKFTTVQWSILSEGLYNAGHSKGARSYGSQWGGQYASYHHNLIAHNQSRSPRINGSRSNDTIALVDFRNNVIFNWGSRGAVYGGEEEIRGGEMKVNFINNYYKPGPATPSQLLFAAPSYVTEGNTAAGYGEWYFAGNYMEGITGGMNVANWLGVDASRVNGADNIRHPYWFPVEPVETQTAQEAYRLVLEKAGAVLPKRDAVDTRIVAEAKGDRAVTGRGIIDSPSEVGGWPTLNSATPPTDTDNDGLPDDWEEANGLNKYLASDARAIGAGGYSNLEIYLNSLVAQGVTGIAEPYAAAAFIAYPNPAADKIYFSSTEIIQKVELYDLSGRLVVAKSNIEAGQEGFCSISHLTSGFYIMKAVFRNGQTVERKLIKQ